MDLSARFFGIYIYRPYVVVSMRMRYMCAFRSSAKGKRERASCPRICASSSVVRPREREATETAEEPARRRVRDRAI